MGQVSILLLLLWTCGTFFRMKQWHNASGFAFGLATAIKLTPLIVLFPLLLLKDWKTLRAFFLSLLGLTMITCLLNSPASLIDYFVHVVPPMSRGILTIINISISASVERLYAALHHDAIAPAVTNQLPAAVILLGKAIAAVVVGVAALFTFRRGSALSKEDRAMIFALFGALSVCVAPVSWQHGSTLCFLALSLLWSEALREPKSNLGLIVLFLGTIAMTTSLDEFAYRNLDSSRAHPILATFLLSFTPIGGIVLILNSLYHKRNQTVSAEKAASNCRVRQTV